MDIQPDATGVFLSGSQGTLRLDALAPDLLRIRATREGGFDPVPSFAVVKTDWEPCPISVREDDAAVTVEAGGLTVRVRRADGAFTVEAAGNAILRDAAFAWDGEGFRLGWVQPGGRHIYGCGEKAGPLERRGKPMVFYNTDECAYKPGDDPLYQSIPFCLGMDGPAAHGLFMDNTFRQTWALGELGDQTASIAAGGGWPDLYVFAGPTPKDVLQRYTELTGRQNLPPLWATGFHQCRYSYYPESTLREVADGFRSRDIPCDVLYFDIHYMDRNRDFTWDSKRFPDPKGLIAALRDQGFRTVAILDPGIPNEPGYAPYDTLMETGLVVRNPDGTPFVGPVWPGDCVFPDFVDARCREWWGGWYRGLVDTGLAGFWNDMNEPAVFERPSLQMPPECIHPGADGHPDVHARYHNVYGMCMIRGTYDALREMRPEERTFVLSRAAYAGTQRYAATWTGDNVASWPHLRMSIAMVLNLGLSGQAISGPDIGGFVEDTTPELLCRWLQAGALFPFCRIHSATPGADPEGTPFQPQEPWVFGEPWTSINRKSIELRYSLLPYLYTLYEEASRTGVPVMRPMIMEFPDDLRFEAVDDQFMVGPNLLVAPVLEEGAVTRTVLLPAGDWYDYRTNERLTGGRTITVQAPIDALPLYVRAGCVLPTQPVVQHTGEMQDVPLVFRVYPFAGGAEGEVYEDDGSSFGYADGAFRRTRVTALGAGRMSITTWSEGAYRSPRPEPRFDIVGE